MSFDKLTASISYLDVMAATQKQKVKPGRYKKWVGVYENSRIRKNPQTRGHGYSNVIPTVLQQGEKARDGTG